MLRQTIYSDNTDAYGFIQLAKIVKKLTPVDWIKIGFQSLTRDGPESLKAEKLARLIGSSKGSFYWHFKDVPEFKSRMLDHWIDQAYSAVTQELDDGLDPETQLYRLMELAARTPEEYGGKQAEPAIRAWARADPMVAAAVAEIDQKRIGFLAYLLADSGKEHEVSAPLIYAAYVGYLSLAGVDEEAVEEGLKLLLRRVLGSGE